MSYNIVTSHFLQILINGLTLSLMDVGDIPYGFVYFEEGFLLTPMSEEHEHLSCAQLTVSVLCTVNCQCVVHSELSVCCAQLAVP